MILLDTNVLSTLMRREPDVDLLHWLDRQPRASIWTTAITIFEIQFGLRIMPAGRKHNLLMQSFQALLEKLDNRIAPFDDAAARAASDLMAARQKKGRPVDLRDTMIAGIVLAHHAVLATRNVAHFEEIQVINPWDI